MTTPSIIPHKLKVKLVELLVKPAMLKSDKTVWGRELKLLGQLITLHPDAEFWQGFSLPYQLNSLAFLKTDKGATILGDAYRLYTFHKTQEKIALDTVDKPTKLAEDVEEPVVTKPRVNALDWADSQDTLF